MSNLNERFKQTKRRFQNDVKLLKFKKFKTKIRVLKQKNNETVEKSTKKIVSKKIEFFLK
jgi:hypothetical protein